MMIGLRVRGFSRAVIGAALFAYAAFGAGSGHAVDHPDLFRLTSPDLRDDGMLTPANAGTGKSPRGPWDCGGQDISPALAWAHAPKETKSFAVLMDDPDAASGRGGSHWLIYDVPPDANGLARDAGKHPPAGAVHGANGRGRLDYAGPCAEPGAKAHHFLFMVYALDIAPGTLAKGLNRAAFLEQIQGHNVAEASLVARYQRPPAKPDLAQKTP